MALVHSEQINSQTTLYLWKLTEEEMELRGMLRNKYNMEDLEAISHPQKKREWLASRLLLQHLAEQTGLPYKGTYKDEHGKAYLTELDRPISLTHTKDYVAVVMGREEMVGVDMERLDPKLSRTAPKYLTWNEYEHADEDLRALAAYWCSKEAMFKLYGKKKISFKDNIYIPPFDIEAEIITGELRDEDHLLRAQIQLRWIEDYCMAIAY
ncbi:4'-phosphopantetheinyl transferase family protein [Dyadobacter tibetensis]|uniref:4'-phosphopantetheinyl transferase family protein n=1 Tax=Dyadobacter tibetensis TaxID=1211851 RepID=UPI000472A544|nr:4'-phosphopantetheinyl transferase superfamily protein [Dyadobacter tibetensis]